MKLMMVCPACLGTGEYMILDECPFCKGNAIIDPPKQILDDLECAEIERELLQKAGRIDTYTLDNLQTEVVLWFKVNMDNSFIGKTKLEALRKAKAWLDGRGAE